MANCAKAKVVQTTFEEAVQTYYNNEKYDVNWKLGDVDGFCHHHYGIGDYDKSILSIVDPETKLQHTIKELHRMETAQANYVLDQFGDITPTDTLLDAGCGRGGTSIMATLRFGCQIEGVTISERQAEFANVQAKKFGVDDRVRFHFRNMLDNGLEDESARLIWNNESTMYVDVFDLFKEHSRVLKKGGRYVCVTGMYNTSVKPQPVKDIDRFYGCDIHQLKTYFQALLANGLVPVNVVDLTKSAIPYWEFRAQSTLCNGVEDFFLNAYRSGQFHYMLIVAVKPKE